MKYFTKILGVVFILSSISGIMEPKIEHKFTGFLALLIGVALLLIKVKTKDTNIPKKQKIKKYYVDFKVAGTFLDERQEVLKDFYEFYYSKDIGECIGSGCIKLVAEPDNPHDPNAILITTMQDKPIGHVPKNLTNRINLNEKFKAHWDITRNDGLYEMSLGISQKY